MCTTNSIQINGATSPKGAICITSNIARCFRHEQPLLNKVKLNTPRNYQSYLLFEIHIARKARKMRKSQAQPQTRQERDDYLTLLLLACLSSLISTLENHICTCLQSLNYNFYFQCLYVQQKQILQKILTLLP